MGAVKTVLEDIKLNTSELEMDHLASQSNLTAPESDHRYFAFAWVNFYTRNWISFLTIKETNT